MAKLDEMAAFVQGVSAGDLAREDLGVLKLHVLDTVGCALGALEAPPIKACRRVVEEMGGPGECTLIGGGKASLPLAGFYNGALVRYLDFMDAYLAPNGECHPSDNFAALLAGAESADASGMEFLMGLGIAYEVICRLSRETKIMRHGFDHTTTLTFSIAAGLARLLKMDVAQTANALAVAGADAPGVLANRTEPLSNWKGLASAEAGFRTCFCVMLARAGITGPERLIEGPGGLAEATRDGWDVDWSEKGLEAIRQVMIKKYDAEARSQSALEAITELRRENAIDPGAVEGVRIETFRPGYDNLGGGRYGRKEEVHVKEQADHNLRYMAAVALLDGEVWPEQYAEGRLTAGDVQGLMQKVTVEPKMMFTFREPREQPTRVRITLQGGRTVACEKKDYEGFPTRPMSWDRVVEKFHRLAGRAAGTELRGKIIAAVTGLDGIKVRELTGLLGEVGGAV